MSSKLFRVIATVLLAGLIITGPAQATKLDLSVIGANYPAWSTMGECQAERSGCQRLHSNACGWEIFSTREIALQIAYAYDDGKTIDVTTMKNGRFDQHVCILAR